MVYNLVICFSLPVIALYVCVRACVCVCVYVCVYVEASGLSIRLLTESSPVQYPGAVVSLNKELYSCCSSLPSCDLAIAGEVNAKLCLSLLIHGYIHLYMHWKLVNQLCTLVPCFS